MVLKSIDININGEVLSVPDNITILEAAKMHGIKIPTLCHFPDQRVKANCRVCVVEVEGKPQVIVSATKPKTQYGMSFDSWGRRFACSNSDHLQLFVYDDRLVPPGSAFAPFLSGGASAPAVLFWPGAWNAPEASRR